MSPPELEFRSAAPDDASRLVAAFDWLFEPPGSRPAQWDPLVAEERLRRASSSAAATVLLAEHTGELVGFCTVYLDIEPVRFGQRAWVEDLAVHPDHRSLGIGKALLDGAKQWARTRGAMHLELDSAFARTEAHRFYVREGPSWDAVCFGWLL